MRADLIGNSKVVYVELYTLSGKEIKVTTAGYAPAAAVKKSAVRHEEVDASQPLFTGVPTIEDIRQGNIGDCYLMAALGAVVQRNPATIYNMMRDNRNGTVTVRLYKPPTADTGAAQTVDIRVNKSLIDDGRRSRGALWVPIIEKAYAVLGQGPGATIKSASYQALGSGDDPGVALRILTGVSSTSLNTGTGGGPMTSGTPMWSQGFMLNYTKKYKPRKAQGTLTDSDITGWNNGQAKSVFGDEGDAFMDWLTLDNNPYVDRLRKAAEDGTIESFQPILSDMNKAGQPSRKDWRDKLADGLKKYYPGVRGTAVYTEQQLSAYDGIQSALQAGKHVATGTRGVAPEKDVNVTEGTGHSGGETKGLGIVGSHAYTVLAVRTDPDSHLRYVTIRNPWGHYGRLYKGFSPSGKLQVETDVSKLEAQSGTFEVELTDFTANYGSTHYN
jgi:hypothetical protein